MSSKVGKFVLWSFVAFGAATLGYLGRQLYLLYNFAFSYSGIKIHEISKNKISVTIYLSFVNRSDVEIILNNQVYKVYLNDHFLSNALILEEVRLKPKGDTIIPINVNAYGGELLRVGIKNINYLLLDRENAIIRTTGSLDIKTSVFGIRNMKVDIRESLKSIVEEGN